MKKNGLDEVLSSLMSTVEQEEPDLWQAIGRSSGPSGPERSSGSERPERSMGSERPERSSGPERSRNETLNPEEQEFLSKLFFNWLGSAEGKRTLSQIMPVAVEKWLERNSNHFFSLMDQDLREEIVDSTKKSLLSNDMFLSKILSEEINSGRLKQVIKETLSEIISKKFSS